MLSVTLEALIFGGKLRHFVKCVIFCKSICNCMTLYVSVYTPVCLPSASDTFYGMTLVATGWGVNTSTTNDDPNASISYVLQVKFCVL